MRELYRIFSYPISDKLFSLVKIACPRLQNQKSRRVSEAITRRFDTCQWFSKAPVRARVTLPEKTSCMWGQSFT